MVVLVKYFDSSLRLWLTSLGLSLIIGFALYISTTNSAKNKVQLGFWQIFRLFLMPFCVSSFAALVKGKNFVLIFLPLIPHEILLAVLFCAALCALVFALKTGTGRNRTERNDELFLFFRLPERYSW